VQTCALPILNRYPVWKYLMIVFALLLGALYTAPNYFGETPALQVTSGRSTLNITSASTTLVEDALKRSGIPTTGISLEGTGHSTSVRARFAGTEEQFKAKLALERDLNRDPANPDYIVTVSLVKNPPAWREKIGAGPMSLGFDLR